MVKPLSTKYPSKSLKRKTQHAKKKNANQPSLSPLPAPNRNFSPSFSWAFSQLPNRQSLNPFLRTHHKTSLTHPGRRNHRMKIVGKSLDHDSDSMASKATLEGSKTLCCSDSDTQIHLPICNYSIFFLMFYQSYDWLPRKFRGNGKIVRLGLVWRLCICYFALFQGTICTEENYFLGKFEIVFD